MVTGDKQVGGGTVLLDVVPPSARLVDLLTYLLRLFQTAINDFLMEMSITIIKR